MKRITLILVLLFLTLILSGCNGNGYIDDDHENWRGGSPFYNKEEIDEMLEQYEEEIYLLTEELKGLEDLELRILLLEQHNTRLETKLFVLCDGVFLESLLDGVAYNDYFGFAIVNSKQFLVYFTNNEDILIQIIFEKIDSEYFAYTEIRLFIDSDLEDGYVGLNTLSDFNGTVVDAIEYFISNEYWNVYDNMVGWEKLKNINGVQ